MGQKNARSSLPPFLFLRISLIHSFIDLSLHNPNLTLNQAPQNLRLRWGGNCIDCSNTEQSLPVTLCNYPQCRQSAFTEEKYQHQLDYPYHPLRAPIPIQITKTAYTTSQGCKNPPLIPPMHCNDDEGKTITICFVWMNGVRIIGRIH